MTTLEEEKFKLEKIHTSKNLADMMMKVVTKDKIKLCSTLVDLHRRQ